MTHYLFLGGELHGTYREVPDDARVFKAFTGGQSPINAPGYAGNAPQAPPNGRALHPHVGGGHVPLAPLVVESWVRRSLTATDPATGDTFRNVLYIHEAIGDPEAMFTMFAAYLALTWARQGEKVTDAEG